MITMGYLNKDVYFKKQMYAERKMEEQKFNTNLTEEQHEVLAELCTIRHKLHTMDRQIIFNTDCSGFRQIEEMFGMKYYDVLEDSIYNRLTELGLPELKVLDMNNLPDCDEYFYCLSADEREEWERKAEQFNNENPNRLCDHTGYSLWVEESGRYEELWDMLEDYNNVIEKYLKDIDKKYGTEYCPSGATRLW